MMQQYAAQHRRFGPVLAGAVVGVLALFAALAVTYLAGTKTGLVLALACIGGPVLGYLALVAPIVFPFSLYVGLVPFDNLLDVGAFGTLTKLLGMLSGVAILFYLIRTRKAVRPTPALFVWAAFYVWAAATAFWAVDANSVFQLLPTALQLLVLYAIATIYPTTRTTIRWVAFAVVVGGALAAAYGAYLFRSGIDVNAANRLVLESSTSAIDPNHFAASLLLPIGLVTAWALYARRPLPLIASAATLFLLLEGVVVSSSRGSLIAIGVMMAYFLIRSANRLRLVVILALPAIVAMLSEWSRLAARFATAFSSGGSGRVDIWKVGLVALKQHWLLGAGYNNFAYAYDQAFLGAHQMNYAAWHRAPHDLLLQTSVEVGIVGLALLLAGWIAQFYTLRGVLPDSEGYPLRIGLEASIVGMFVAAIFLDVMVMKYLWLIFVVVALVRNAYARRLPDA